MKITITDGCFIHEVDWSIKNKIDGDFLDEYRPDLEESIESFLRLLENIYPQEKIAAYIKAGIQYSALEP